MEEVPDAPAAGAFGEYDLLSVIARGGMGVVYLARQRAAGRMVALKMIAAPHLAGEVVGRRFRAEAEAVAGLEHAHIVPLYDAGEVDGQLFFTMRLMEGGTLTEAMQRAPRRPDAALFSKVARAIHYAHERGVLHRDLKPANILLDAAGEPGVADFGLALRADAGTRLTMSGAAMGTPDYMAPEQASGKSSHATTAADIYSLGAMLYEWLAGQPPFASPTPLETMRRALSEEAPRPSSIHPQVDRDLETIALRCLEKDPARRYASAAALADDLDRQQRGEPIHARPVGTLERLVKWTRRRPALAALLALALIVPAGAAYFIAVYRAREENTARLAERSAQERYAADIFHASRALETGRPGLAVPLLEGCDPALRGFEWNYLRGRLAGDDVRVLASPVLDGRTATFARFHPLDHRVAVADRAGVVTLGEVHGAAPPLRWQAHGGQIDLLAFSSDGAVLASVCLAETLTKFWTVPASGGAVPLRPLRELHGPVVHVQFSPRGNFISVGMEPQTGDPAQRPRTLDIYAGVYDSQPRRLPVSAQLGWFSPDGARLYAHEIVSMDTTPCQVFDTTTWGPVLTSDGRPQAFKFFGQGGSVSFSADGKRMANLLHAADVFAQYTSPLLPGMEDLPCWLAPAPLPSQRPKCVKFLPPRQPSPQWRDVSPADDVEFLAIATDHGATHFLRTDNWLEAFALKGHTAPVTVLDFSSDGRWMVTCSSDHSARLWHPHRQRTPPVRMEGFPTRMFLTDGGRSIGGVWEGAIQIKDIATGDTIHTGPTLRAAHSFEFFYSRKGSVAGTMNITGVLQANHFTARVAREPDVAARMDRFFTWQTAQMRQDSGILSLRTSPDGRTVAVSRANGSICLMDADSLEARETITTRGTVPCRLSWSDDGQWLTAADNDGQLEIWRRQESGPWQWQRKLDAAGLTGGVAISPDGQWLAIAGGKAPAAGLLVELATGALTELRGAPIVECAFSADSRRLATAADKKVALWQVPSGRFLCELHGEAGGGVGFLAFCDDGRALIHTSDPGFHIWRAGD